MQTMPKVKDGECMVSLADKLGMQDYHTLYDDTVNATLKRRRPNPNQLRFGDNWQDPPGKGKVYSKAVDKTWTFFLKPKKLPKLRIVLVDAENKPLPGTAWKLTAPKALSGKTTKNGLIEIPDFPPQERSGTLEVTWKRRPPQKPSPAPQERAVTKPTYPRPIKGSEFSEDLPQAPSGAGNLVVFALKIGGLPTFDEDSGVRARLHNLGYGCYRGSDSERTKKCVLAFQRWHLKQETPSGRVSEIRKDARDNHDNL
jgi:hypothetical protein